MGFLGCRATPSYYRHSFRLRDGATAGGFSAFGFGLRTLKECL